MFPIVDPRNAERLRRLNKLLEAASLPVVTARLDGTFELDPTASRNQTNQAQEIVNAFLLNADAPLPDELEATGRSERAAAVIAALETYAALPSPTSAQTASAVKAIASVVIYLYRRL